MKKNKIIVKSLKSAPVPIKNSTFVFFLTGGCAMVKESQKSNIDKEYSMEISANCDTHVRLFCRGMNTDSPKEYITLFSVQKENFAYIHDYIQPSASKDSCVKANGKLNGPLPSLSRPLLVS